MSDSSCSTRSATGIFHLSESMMVVLNVAHRDGLSGRVETRPYSPYVGRDLGLGEEVAEAAAASGVSELAQGLGLYLSDALTGDTELTAYLFQGAAAAII